MHVMIRCFLDFHFLGMCLQVQSDVSLRPSGATRVARCACLLQDWPLDCTWVRLSSFLRLLRASLLRQTMSQARVPLDDASPKRRRLRVKSRMSEVLLPSGALPVAHDVGRVAAAELDAGAEFGVFVAACSMCKTVFSVAPVLGAETRRGRQVARHVACSWL